jgi:hypothetical protein
MDLLTQFLPNREGEGGRTVKNRLSLDSEMVALEGPHRRAAAHEADHEAALPPLISKERGTRHRQQSHLGSLSL